MSAGRLAGKERYVSGVIDRHIVKGSEEWTGRVGSRRDALAPAREDLHAARVEERGGGDGAVIVDDGIEEAAEVGIVGISHVRGTALASKYALGEICEEGPE